MMRWVSWLFKIPQYVAYKMKCKCSQYLRTLYQGPVIAGLGQAIRRSDADLVVASSFPLLHMYTAVKAAKKAAKPVILVGGLHPEDAWSFDRPMIAEAMKAADACIAYTGYEAGKILEDGSSPGKYFHTLAWGWIFKQTIPRPRRIFAIAWD